MAITFDAVTDSAAVTGADPTNFNATVNAGTNGCLVVCAFARDTTISGVTADGNAMTSAVSLSGTNGLAARIFYLVAPPTGTVAISIDLAGGPTYAGGVAISLHGVTQSSPIDDTDSVETNGANPSFSGLTTVTDGCAVIDALASNNTASATMNAETNRVERSNFLCLFQGRAVAASTIITKATAGSVTMGWDIGANNSAYVGAAFKPAAVAAATGLTRRVLTWDNMIRRSRVGGGRIVN